MRYLKLFEEYHIEELEGLYDEGADLINDAADLLGDPEMSNEDPHVVIDKLRKNGSQEALELADLIEDINNQIAEMGSGFDDFDDDFDDFEEDFDESKKHPGFEKTASKIARKQGISKDDASAILASSTRKVSASAKSKNPRLKRVK